jgi:RND family efflux transporter MFP subunit
MRTVLLAMVFVCLVVIAVGCGNKPAPLERPAAAPISVTAAPASRSLLPSAYEASGTVRARVSATVSAKLMGYAREVRAQIGDRVTEGQTLVVLDARDQDAAIRQAESARDEVQSAIPEAESAIAAAKSQADLAQVTFERIRDLLSKRSVTQQEFDEASARLKAAQAACDMARSRRLQLDAKLAQAEQAVRMAGIQQTYTSVSAPFSGTILTKSIEPGSLVAPGAPLFTMEREGPFRLEANVEESRLAAARVGRILEVAIDGIPHGIRGRVAEVVPAVDPASRTGIVKIDLPALANLRSGLFGRARFEDGGREVLTVPAESVAQSGQLQSVFVVESGVARLRLVTLGFTMGKRVEVLSGLNEGESVIAPVPAGVRDGTPVEVRL